MSSTSIANLGLNPTDVVRASNHINAAVLSSGAGQAFDVPVGAQFVRFEGTADFYVTMGSTGATAPAVSITNGTAGEIGPLTRNIGSTNATPTLTIASSSDNTVTMAWHS